MLTTCPNCGKTVRTGAKFCSHCGKEMPATVPLSQEAALPPEPEHAPEPESAALEATAHEAAVPEAAPAEPQHVEAQSILPASEICLHCGKTIRQGIKFCNFCGKPTAAAGIGPTTPPSSQAVPPVPPPPAAIPPVQPLAGVEAPRKKGRKKGWLVALILLLLILCALAAAAFLALRGTFGDLQLPEPLEELSSRLQLATPTSEPTRTPKPTKTPTATETPEPTFTPTLTKTPTLTPTPEPEYIFYDSFETGLNDWWFIFGPNLPNDANEGKLVLFSSLPYESGIINSSSFVLTPGTEIGVTASLYEVPPNDSLKMAWQQAGTVSPAQSATSPAVIEVNIGTTLQTMALNDTVNNFVIASCSVSKLIDSEFYTYTVRIEGERIGLYMDDLELCSVGSVPDNLAAEGYLVLFGNAILEEVFISLE